MNRFEYGHGRQPSPSSGATAAGSGTIINARQSPGRAGIPRHPSPGPVLNRRSPHSATAQAASAAKAKGGGQHSHNNGSGNAGASGTGEVDGEAAAPSTDDNSGVKAPLVFYCRKCRYIVGDSYAFVSTNKKLKMITLSAASNIALRKSHVLDDVQVHTEEGVPDTCCTYFPFLCANCNTELGRKYLSTTKGMDMLRDNYSFFIHTIGSYELGTSQRGGVLELDADSANGDNSNPVVAMGSASLDADGCCAGCKLLVNELAKVALGLFLLVCVFISAVIAGPASGVGNE
jgi:hypothetical protein